MKHFFKKKNCLSTNRGISSIVNDLTNGIELKTLAL